MTGRRLFVSISMIALVAAMCGVAVFGGLKQARTPEKSCCAVKPATSEVSSTPAVVKSEPAAAPVADITDYEVNTSNEPPPGLASVPFPTGKEREFWRMAAKKLWLRPPCCGACSFLKQSDFRDIAQVLSAKATATPANLKLWNRYGPSLAASLERQDPQLYKQYLSLRNSVN